jgi:hypothetical protein
MIVLLIKFVVTLLYFFLIKIFNDIVARHYASPFGRFGRATASAIRSIKPWRVNSVR